MSLQWKFHLDWLSITGKIDKRQGDMDEVHFLSRVRLTQEILSGLGLKQPLLQTVQPAKHYEISFVDRKTGFRINFGNNLSSQGWQVVASGSALNEHDVNPYISAFLEVWKGKVTRADYALDLIWSGLKVVDFADAYREEHGLDGQKSFSFIKSKSGETAYVGSRASERMLRFYDKGGQQNVPIDWLRLEFEFKGGYAHRAVETALYDYREIVAEMEKYIKVPTAALSGVLRAISAGVVPEAKRSPTAVTDRVKWFHGQVYQAFINLCQEDQAAARKVWEMYHSAWYAHEVWRMFNDELDKKGKEGIE